MSETRGLNADELLQRALDRGGNTHSVNDVWERVTKGLAKVWVNGESLGVTEVITFPQKRVCRIWLASGNLDDLKEMEPAVCEWAKQNQCVEVIIDGRQGWERIWKDYRATRVTLVKELKQ